MNFVCPPLYHYDTKSKVRRWQLSTSGSRIYTEYGVAGGKQIRTSREVETNSSGRDLKQQIRLEAIHDINKKLTKGYVVDASLAASDTPSTKEGREVFDEAVSQTGQGVAHSVGGALRGASDTFQPMLAKTWNPGDPLVYPVCVQPKIDGVRCVFYLQDGVVTASSRSGKLWPAGHFVSIKKDVLKLIRYLGEDTRLDGEIFSPTLGFESLISSVRTFKNTPESQEVLKYYWYDIQSEDPYEVRLRSMRDAYAAVKTSTIVLLSCQEVNSEEEIIRAHRGFVAAGNEGTIIREPSKPYAFGARNSMYKYKDFFDDEAEITGYHWNKGTREGTVTFEAVTRDGKTFDVTPGGTLEAQKAWSADPDKLIGSMITYEYRRLSKEGKPIHAVGKVIRDYE